MMKKDILNCGINIILVRTPYSPYSTVIKRREVRVRSGFLKERRRGLLKRRGDDFILD